MGVAGPDVRRRPLGGTRKRRERAWMARGSTARNRTHTAQANTRVDHMCTTGGTYPQVRTPQPHTLLVAGLSLDLVEWDAVIAGDGFDDALGREALALRVVEDVLQHLLRELGGDGHGVERRVRDDPRQCALELANVRDDPLREEIDDRRRDRDVLRLGLRTEDRDPRLEVRRRDVRDQTPLEPRAQPVFQLRDRFRRPVARENDLLALLVDRVECVEELFLRSLFAGDELDIVDEQDIDAPVALAEFLALLRADRIDELVGELLARGIHDALLWMARDHRVTDRVHEMCLSET